MHLSISSKPYIIPEYSLTGDLLSYLTCGLQYRYHNKGSLPPSTPVQLWFGEFIHGVMEEAYLSWKKSQLSFKWPWEPQIRCIELNVAERLSAKGLNPPYWLFCPYSSEEKEKEGFCKDTNHPHKLTASKRAEKAINTWGPHLFPLVSQTEIKLKGIRPMPKANGIGRSDYYGITGVVDVISSINIHDAEPGNLILHYIHRHPELMDIIDNLDSPEFEIIIDYKGMMRPGINDPNWAHHEWQILTYAWLRSQQPEAKPVIAGILFYLDELSYSNEGMKVLKEEVQTNSTDVMPHGLDMKNIKNWKPGLDLPKLTVHLTEERSIKIVPINHASIQESLEEFNDVVLRIESSVLSELGGKNITSSWECNPKERTCTVCDFKTFCMNSAPRRYIPTVP